MRKLGVARLVFGVGVAFLYIPIITLIIFS
jgi:ABC-type spermidine/putrescine transport system permease subunit II